MLGFLDNSSEYSAELRDLENDKRDYLDDPKCWILEETSASNALNPIALTLQLIACPLISERQLQKTNHHAVLWHPTHDIYFSTQAASVTEVVDPRARHV